MALVAPPEMQICTSEIAAVNPPMGGFVEVGTDQQICITVCCRRCRLGGCAKLRILDLLASG